MANVLANPTGGFTEFQRMDGGSPTAGMTPVWIASTDAGVMFRGDPVITSSGGGANNSGAYITSLNTVSSLSLGFMCRGIFMGMEQYVPTVGRVVWNNFYNGTITGSTGDIKAYIIDDPQRLWLVQGSTSAAITSSYIGLNASITFNTTTGNTTTGLSNVALASSTIVSTNASLPFRIVDFYSAYAPPGVPAVGTAAFINGTDNTNVANMVIVRLNNCDRLSLTARSS